MERYLYCEHCNYARGAGDDGRQFDELDPFGPPGRAGDPMLLCAPCIKEYFEQCECCQQYVPQGDLPYMSRNGVCYCQGCYDYGCDLTSACERPQYKTGKAVPSMVAQIGDQAGRTLRYKRDKYGNVIREPAFPTAVQSDGPTDEELAATYKSLGFEYHMNTKPEEGKQ